MGGKLCPNSGTPSTSPRRNALTSGLAYFPYRRQRPSLSAEAWYTLAGVTSHSCSSPARALAASQCGCVSAPRPANGTPVMTARSTISAADWSCHCGPCGWSLVSRALIRLAAATSRERNSRRIRGSENP